MVEYPIHVSSPGYKGKSEKQLREALKLADLARKLERHINGIVSSGECGVFEFGYSNLAEELNESRDDVRRLLMPVDGGHNGITVKRLSL